MSLDLLETLMEREREREGEKNARDNRCESNVGAFGQKKFFFHPPPPYPCSGLCIINDHDKYARSFSQVRRIDDRVDRVLAEKKIPSKEEPVPPARVPLSVVP